MFNYNSGLSAPLKCSSPSQRSVKCTHGTTASPALFSTPCHFHFLPRMTKYSHSTDTKAELKIRGLWHHSSGDEQYSLPQSDAVSLGEYFPTFRRTLEVWSFERSQNTVQSSAIWRRVVGRILSDVSADRRSTFFRKVAKYWPNHTALSSEPQKPILPLNRQVTATSEPNQITSTRFSDHSVSRKGRTAPGVVPTWTATHVARTGHFAVNSGDVLKLCNWTSICGCLLAMWVVRNHSTEWFNEYTKLY